MMRAARALAASLALLAFATSAVPAGYERFREPYDHATLFRAASEIIGALAGEDYDRLDGLYAQFSDPSARTSDGSWMIVAFQLAFDQQFREMSPFDSELLFARWKEHNPASELKPIAQAFYLETRALKVRGSCPAHPMTDPAAKKAFASLLSRAREAVDLAGPRSRASPLWHTVNLLVAGGQGRTASELDTILDASARQFPLYEPLYAARLMFDLPDWGGDYDQVDAFVRRSVERTKSTEGRTFYARLYVDLAQWASSCGDPFEESNVSWDDMKPAFEDMLARYPDVWNRNLYATFACRERDEPTTRRLLSELGKSADLGWWSTGISTDSCYRMIAPPPPEPMKSAALAG